MASATFTVDSTQPAAPAFHPSDGGTTGTAGTNITLTFGEAIKRSSAGEDFTTESQLKKILTLKASGSGGNDLTYSVGITGGGTVITVDPAAHLADGPVYVAVSNGYFDANGARLRHTAPTRRLRRTPRSARFEVRRIGERRRAKRRCSMVGRDSSAVAARG